MTRSPAARALLYARTLRHLRPVQLLYMPLRRVQARLPLSPNPPGEVRLTADPAVVAALVTLGVDGPAGVVERAEATVRREFTFLGHAERLPHIRWDERQVSHLWSYNLHYFDYALDLAWASRRTGEARFAEAFVDLALGWIEGTEPGRGDGWEPYAVSLRLVNWIQACLLLGDSVRPEARRALEASLALQAAWLERRLERHIQANHLQKNFQALAVAGLCLEGRDAQRWRGRGLAGSWAAVREQVLDDGCHFERSPMYHLIALQDFLELFALCAAVGEPVPTDVRDRVTRMVEAVGVLTRTDGTLHLFNDAANGIAPSRAYVQEVAAVVLGDPPAAAGGLLTLPVAGYFGWDEGPSGARMVIDCGEPGPRHQPGHAHCDLLSFELDLAGRPFVVDAGVHGYAGDPYREYVRSTRAHNTVMIGEQEQSEVWGSYRVARRARVLDAACGADGDGFRFEGSYAPYHSRGAMHARTVAGRGPRWVVTDRVSGAAGAPLRSFLHLHPSWTVRRVGVEVVAQQDSRYVRILPFGFDRLEIHIGAREPTQGWYCPEFGVAVPAPVLEATIVRSDGRDFGFRIEDDGD
jgi:hypothetical protein